MIVGRPLRFLGVIVGGWIAMRVTILWWPDSLTVEVAEVAPIGPRIPVPPAPAIERSNRVLSVARLEPSARSASANFVAPTNVLLPRSEARPTAAVIAHTAIIPGLPAPLASPPERRTRSRFAGSVWLVARDGAGLDGIFGAQLGGSQAGARLTYALTESRRLALAARVSTPLGPGAQELALGFEWQPTRLPVRVVAEQRIALNGGGGGPTIGVVGGFGPRIIAAGLALEGYAQSGVIGRGEGEGFADGAVRLARPLAKLGDVRFDLGAGVWGAAQRGASRVDLGPSLVAHVPLVRQPVRLSLDWRQRIAGNATPGSGLVLSVGADF
ncbi:hypothetical protein ASG11_01655 [Sphingomonas sp. Leaf357]|uniref:hypothetical protein n=1 Tax=Sphingomonas sp. Leaf357 TaxID=1736350 RepID=UPI0006F9BC6E|nr:hypothetical protein [Sphingomonas sp. Leaf357]KQS03129.1 hypothetical protein ASG11_01655 [Sphingomonas sp. Leaf357]